LLIALVNEGEEGGPANKVEMQKFHFGKFLMTEIVDSNCDELIG
jgi:hypothetical protein